MQRRYPAPRPRPGMRARRPEETTQRLLPKLAHRPIPTPRRRNAPARNVIAMPARRQTVPPQGRQIAQHTSLQERYRNRLLRLVNEERALVKVPPVTLNNTLNRCARAHNADLAFRQRKLSHVGADGAKLSTRLVRCGYSYKYASENVARGQGTPTHVVSSWMKSEGHRRNLLSARAKQMGVHVGRGSDGKLYWAQMFGSF